MHISKDLGLIYLKWLKSKKLEFKGHNTHI